MMEIIRHFGNYSIVRSDYVQICDGDICAAQILSLLEDYTAGRLSLSSQPNFDPELWIYSSVQNFIDDLLGVFNKHKIIKALNLLHSMGFVEKKTGVSQYRFNIEAVQEALDEVKNQKEGGAV